MNDKVHFFRSLRCRAQLRDMVAARQVKPASHVESRCALLNPYLPRTAGSPRTKIGRLTSAMGHSRRSTVG
jgi:hypothetical protein